MGYSNYKKLTITDIFKEITSLKQDMARLAKHPGAPCPQYRAANDFNAYATHHKTALKAYFNDLPRRLLLQSKLSALRATLPDSQSVSAPVCAAA